VLLNMDVDVARNVPEDGPGAGPARSLEGVARAAVAVGVVVAVFGFALPRFASAGAVWHAVRHVGWRGAALLVATASWNLVTYWLVWMAAVPKLGLRRAALIAQAPTAVANTLPAGSYVAVALTYSMLRSWGHRRSSATLALVVTGVWNNFAKLALPVVALAALAIDGDVDAPRVVAAISGLGGLVAAVAVFAAAMRSDTAATRAARVAAGISSPVLRLLRRPAPRGWDVAVRRFRAGAGDLLAARWRRLTAATTVGHLSLFLVLLVSVRTTGVPAAEVSWAEMLAVFAFARLATAVPFSPGGLGVVELALTTGLVAAGGARAPVVASVLVYRALTYLVQIPLGAAAYLLWRRTAPHADVAPATEAVTVDVDAADAGIATFRSSVARRAAS
jgi:putative heme transporter